MSSQITKTKVLLEVGSIKNLSLEIQNELNLLNNELSDLKFFLFKMQVRDENSNRFIRRKFRYLYKILRNLEKKIDELEILEEQIKLLNSAAEIIITTLGEELEGLDLERNTNTKFSIGNI